MLAITSINDGSRDASVSVNLGRAALTLAPLHLQHFCLSLTSQAGLEHWSSHFGRGQVVGLAHDHEHDVSSQSGAQFAFGATHVVWH